MPSQQRLTVTPEGKGVVLLPHGALGRPGLGCTVTLLVESAVLLAGSGQTVQLTMLVDGVHDPVDTRILADDGVGSVDHDNLVIFVGGILVQPVGAENAQVSAA